MQEGEEQGKGLEGKMSNKRGIMSINGDINSERLV